jgi:hypothetical protein
MDDGTCQDLSLPVRFLNPDRISGVRSERSSHQPLGMMGTLEPGEYRIPIVGQPLDPGFSALNYATSAAFPG